MSKISRRRRDSDPQGRQTCWASPRRRCPSCLRVQRYGNFSVPPNLSPTFFTFSCIFLHFAVKGRLFRPKRAGGRGRRRKLERGTEEGEREGKEGACGTPLPYYIYTRARGRDDDGGRDKSAREGRQAFLTRVSCFFFGGAGSDYSEYSEYSEYSDGSE